MKQIYLSIAVFFIGLLGLCAQPNPAQTPFATAVANNSFPTISAFENDAVMEMNLNLYFSGFGKGEAVDYQLLSNSFDSVATAKVVEDTLLAIVFNHAGQTNIHIKSTTSTDTLVRQLIVGVQPRIEGDFLVANFDSLTLEPESYWNGSDTPGGFVSGVVNFYNKNTGWSWEGWSYSNISDNTTAGFDNQYSAITGAGFNNNNTHSNYGVGYISSDWNSFQPVPLALSFSDKRSHRVKGLFITNSTYAALSMENGDAFAKKFGGNDGREPDFLKIFAWGLNNGVATDSVEFMLADFRFEDPAKDYIVKTWQWMELSALGEIDTLLFSIASTDVGEYGINTPTYFNIDNIYVEPNNSLVLAQALNDVVAYVNNEAILIDISNTFAPQSATTIIEIAANSNPDLVDVVVEEQTLKLSFTPEMAGSAEIEVRAVLGTDTVSDVFSVQVLEKIVYTEGVFFVNEGWFGHDKGSLNFLKNDGEMVYRVLARENPDMELGITTSFGTVYGGNAYFVSKQAPRLVVADAKTMKVKASIDKIGDADGRAFAGITPQKAYISTSEGIYRFNIETLSLGDRIEGPEGQIGNMARAGSYVFAVSRKEVFVIDAESDTVVTSFGNGNYDGLTQSRDGKMWVGAAGSLLQIDPFTLDTLTLKLPQEVKTPSSWAAWNANSLCSSAAENAIYFTPDGGFDGSNEVYKYHIGDLTSLQTPFISLPDTLVFSGAGIRINPADNSMYIMARKRGWGESYATNMIYRYDAATGEQLDLKLLDSYYWFPSVPVFPDNYAPQLAIENLSIENQDILKVNLRNLVSDPDNLIAAAVISGEIVEGAGLAAISIVNDTLTAAFLPGNMGVVSYRVTVLSNGIAASETITITSLSSAASSSGIVRMKVYPNPASNKIRIDAPGGADYHVRLHTLAGHLVYNNSTYSSHDEIDISMLPAGIYLLKVTGKQAGSVMKIVKE